jgi:hypothetical protein
LPTTGNGWRLSAYDEVLLRVLLRLLLRVLLYE